MAKKQNTTGKPATNHEIRMIIGPADDELVADIIRTGATYGEVLQAFEWLEGNDHMGGGPAGTITHVRAARVHKILEQERETNGRER